MKSPSRNSLGYGCLYFFLLLTGALLIRDMEFDPDLFATIDRLGEVSNLSDPATFAGAALDVFQTGWVSPNNTWVFNLWPPGFVFLEAGILKVFGVGAPIVLVLQVLACAALALMLSLQRQLLLGFTGNGLATALPMLLFAFPMPRIFLLQPYGVVLGEVFSIAFFLSAGLMLLLAAEGRSLGRAALAGVFFAVAAYFRSQYESILMATSGLTVPLVLWCLWQRARSGSAERRADCATAMQVIGVALVVAHTLMIPWRMHSHAVSKNFSWVQTSGHIFQIGLKSDKSLVASNGEFFVLGAGNVACRVEPAYCDQTDPKLFFKAFVAHPVEWYSYKLSKLPNFWSTFAAPHSFRFTDWHLMQEAVGYSADLLILISTIPLLLGTRGYRWWLIMTWSIASLYAACLVIFTFAHFEARYFYLLKIFAFMWSSNMVAIWWGARHRIAGSSPVPARGGSEMQPT